MLFKPLLLAFTIMLLIPIIGCATETKPAASYPTEQAVEKTQDELTKGQMEKPDTLLHVPGEDFIILSGKEVTFEGKSGDFKADISESVKDVTFLIRRGSPNMTDIIVFIDDVGYNLGNRLGGEVVGLDEGGDLMIDYYIQLTAYDLNNNGNKEVFVSIGDKSVDMSTTVFEYTGDKDNPYEKMGTITGQEYMLIESSQIRVPIGGVGRLVDYHIKNGQLISLDAINGEVGDKPGDRILAFKDGTMLYSGIDVFGKNKSEIIAIFGSPDQVDSWIGSELFIYSDDNVMFHFPFHGENEGKVVAIEFYDNATLFGVLVGMTLEEIESILGKADYKTIDPADGFFGLSYHMGDYIILFDSTSEKGPTISALIIEKEPIIEETIENGTGEAIVAYDPAYHMPELSAQAINILSGIRLLRSQSGSFLNAFIQMETEFPPSNPNSYGMLKGIKDKMKESLLYTDDRIRTLDGILRQADFEAWQNEWVRSYIDYSIVVVHLKAEYMELIVQGCYYGEQMYLDEAEFVLTAIINGHEALDSVWE